MIWSHNSVERKSGSHYNICWLSSRFLLCSMDQKLTRCLCIELSWRQSQTQSTFFFQLTTETLWAGPVERCRRPLTAARTLTLTRETFQAARKGRKRNKSNMSQRPLSLEGRRRISWQKDLHKAQRTDRKGVRCMGANNATADGWSPGERASARRFTAARLAMNPT